MYLIEPNKIDGAIVYKTKNSSNQKMKLIFSPYYAYNHIYWYVCFWVGKNKIGFQENKSTGKSGLSSLLWAKNALLDFVSKVDTGNVNHICISWTDNRRRNTYLRGLSTLGFKKERMATQMILHLKL